MRTNKPVIELVRPLNARLRAELVRRRRPFRGQRWWVRVVWKSNGKIHSRTELYRHRIDAVNALSALAL